jgi:hypothetical protein
MYVYNEGSGMATWKKVLIFGSLGAGAALLLAGRRPAAIAVATAGLAMLASEYPETFEGVWENAPEYVNRGVRIFNTLTEIAEHFAEQAGRSGHEPLREINEPAAGS